MSKLKNLKGKTKPRGAKFPFSKAEYKRMRRLLRGSSDRFKIRNLLLLCVAVNTSYRAGDILRLTIGDVYRNGKFLEKFWFEQQKTKELNIIYLSEVILKDLKEAKDNYHQQFSDSYFDTPGYPLFPSQFRSKGFKPLSYDSFNSLVKRLSKDIGLDPQFYGCHSLRSSVPIEYYNDTNDIAGASSMFGHKSLNTTRIYLKKIDRLKAANRRDTYFFDG